MMVDCEGQKSCEVCPYGVDGKCTKAEYKRPHPFDTSERIYSRYIMPAKKSPVNPIIYITGIDEPKRNWWERIKLRYLKWRMKNE